MIVFDIQKYKFLLMIVQLHGRKRNTDIPFFKSEAKQFIEEYPDVNIRLEKDGKTTNCPLDISFEAVVNYDNLIIEFPDDEIEMLYRMRMV